MAKRSHGAMSSWTCCDHHAAAQSLWRRPPRTTSDRVRQQAGPGRIERRRAAFPIPRLAPDATGSPGLIGTVLIVRLVPASKRRQHAGTSTSGILDVEAISGASRIPSEPHRSAPTILPHLNLCRCPNPHSVEPRCEERWMSGVDQRALRVAARACAAARKNHQAAKAGADHAYERLQASPRRSVPDRLERRATTGGSGSLEDEGDRGVASQGRRLRRRERRAAPRRPQAAH